MKQNIVRKENNLLSAINVAIAGYTKNAATLPLSYHTGAALTLNRGQAIAARDLHDAGKVDLKDYREVLVSKAQETRRFNMAARDILQPSLGRRYSASWAGTGFNGSLRIPVRPEDLEPMIESLRNFFVANPTKEAANSEITAAKADELYNALLDARTDVTAQEAANRTLYENRIEKFDVLYKRLRGMVKELSQVLPPLDSRWLDYGFAIPGLRETPDQPGKITATVTGNAVSVKWKAVARAEYYRVWMKVEGVNQELVWVGSPSDLNFTIEQAPANAVIRIGISAVNNGGESAVSELTTVTTV